MVEIVGGSCFSDTRWRWHLCLCVDAALKVFSLSYLVSAGLAKEQLRRQHPWFPAWAGSWDTAGGVEVGAGQQSECEKPWTWSQITWVWISALPLTAGVTLGGFHNVCESTWYDASQAGCVHQMLAFCASLRLSFLMELQVAFLSTQHIEHAEWMLWIPSRFAGPRFHPHHLALLCWTSLESRVLLDDFHVSLIEMVWNYGLHSIYEINEQTYPMYFLCKFWVFYVGFSLTEGSLLINCHTQKKFTWRKNLVLY